MTENNQQESSQHGLFGGRKIGVADIALMAILRKNENESNKDRDTTNDLMQKQLKVLSTLLAASTGTKKVTPEEIKALLKTIEPEDKVTIKGRPIEEKTRTQQFIEGWKAPWHKFKHTWQLGEYSPMPGNKKAQEKRRGQLKQESEYVQRATPVDLEEDTLPESSSGIVLPSKVESGGEGDSRFVHELLANQNQLLKEMLGEIKRVAIGSSSSSVNPSSVQRATPVDLEEETLPKSSSGIVPPSKVESGGEVDSRFATPVDLEEETLPKSSSGIVPPSKVESGGEVDSRFVRESESVQRATPIYLEEEETLPKSSSGIVPPSKVESGGEGDSRFVRELLANQNQLLKEMLGEFKRVATGSSSSSVNPSSVDGKPVAALLRAKPGESRDASPESSFADAARESVVSMTNTRTVVPDSFVERLSDIGDTLNSIKQSTENIEAIVKDQSSKRVLGEGGTVGVDDPTVIQSGSSGGGTSGGGLVSSILSGMGIAGIGSKILEIFKTSKLATMLGGLAAMLKAGVGKILAGVGGALSTTVKKLAGGVSGASGKVLSGAKNLAQNKGLLQGLGKAAPIAGAAVGAIGTVTEFSDISEQEDAGEITAEEAKRKRASALGGGFGSTAGSVIGGVVGSVLGPAGSVAGAVAGGYAGGMFGEFVGEKYHDTLSVYRKPKPKDKWTSQEIEADYVKKEKLLSETDSETYKEYEELKKKRIEEHLSRNPTASKPVVIGQAIKEHREVYRELLNSTSEDSNTETEKVNSFSQSKERLSSVTSSKERLSSVTSSKESVVPPLSDVTLTELPISAIPRHTPKSMRTVLDEYNAMVEQENAPMGQTNVVSNQVVNNNVNNSSIMPIKAEPRTMSAFHKYLERTAVY